MFIEPSATTIGRLTHSPYTIKIIYIGIQFLKYIFQRLSSLFWYDCIGTVSFKSVSSALAVTLWVLAGGASPHAERVLGCTVLVGEAPALPPFAGAGLHPVLRPRGRRSGLAWGGLGRAGERLLLQAGLPTGGDREGPGRVHRLNSPYPYKPKNKTPTWPPHLVETWFSV